MVTNNKVLTVSYGTFSCTLEGFDDSFGTMKVIAEYFRDLAADDRYFGAEPPVPDTEMLARIAQNEVERRVMAHHEQGAIVLRATDANDPVAAPKETSEPIEAQETATADVPVVEESELQQEEAPQEDTAKDIQEAVVEEAPAPQETVAEDDLDDRVIAAALAETLAVAADEISVTTVQIDEDDTDIVTGEEDVIADIETEMSQDIIQDDTEFAIVDLVADDAPFEDDMQEVAHDDLQESMPEPVQAIQEALHEEQPEASESEETTWDDFADYDDAEEIAETTSESEAPVEEDSIAAKLRRIRAVVSKAEAEPDADDFLEDEHADTLNVSQPDVQDAAQEETTPVSPVRARVIRMKRSDFENAVADGLLEADADDTQEDTEQTDAAAPVEEIAAEPQKAPVPSSLSDDQEAELLAELAAVEAELSGDVTEEATDQDVSNIFDDNTTEDADLPAENDSQRTRHLTENTPEESANLSRILKETNDHMDEPEGNRRRNAIAHLRAAVAATRADKGMGQTEREKEEAANPYREDLATVMRGKKTSQPVSKEAKSHPAPLKLVASQRVDAPDAKDTQAEPVAEAHPQPDNAQRGPVRPRRVSTAADREELARQASAAAIPVAAEPSDAADFAEYADSVGADKLPDILEAAAAYLSYVEGRDQFSRPMLMRLARQTAPDDFNREDGLRSFGQLLRQNKIEKIAGGRFTASDLINFKPQDRRAS